MKNGGKGDRLLWGFVILISGFNMGTAFQSRYTRMANKRAAELVALVEKANSQFAGAIVLVEKANAIAEGCLDGKP